MSNGLAGETNSALYDLKMFLCFGELKCYLFTTQDMDAVFYLHVRFWSLVWINIAQQISFF